MNKAFKEEALKRILVADEQFFDRNKEYWNNYMDGIGAAFDLPYPQEHAKLKKLGEELTKDFERNPDATLTASLAPPWHKIYIQSIGLGTHSNAIRASVEIYISKPGRANFLAHCLPACL